MLVKHLECAGSCGHGWHDLWPWRFSSGPTVRREAAGASPQALASLGDRYAVDREIGHGLGETLRHRWRADDVPLRDRRPLLLRALRPT